ncbi:efflux RND transporter periplasmic adaptor subunit [Pleionea sediminis]|uniref:efflux RND transporter periplasmic adaptor subunit n=1 Tax=Pleionea sediminis TaxID=2569479 RepID=UPI001185A66E|nr:efflux RND transporter periplasmic adaptor subunit [Pleionea sediminis]
MSDNSQSRPPQANANGKSSIVIVMMLIVSALLVWLIFSTEPEAKREGATKKTPMLVEVLKVERQDYKPTIRAMGVVEPAQVITLSAQVSGQVIEVLDSFEPGRQVTKGQPLIKVDSSDYELRMKQLKAQLAQANADFIIEQGEQERAKSDYRAINSKLSGLRKSLVLREPQLKIAQSRLDAAEAELAQAQLELSRTLVKAPFDGQIISQMTNLGAMVSEGSPIARLQGNRRYWVKVSLPLSQIKWLPIQSMNQNLTCTSETSTVVIRNRTAWNSDEYRTGCIKQVVGELTAQTRMVQLLVEVLDPLALTSKSENLPSLMVGSYVEAELPIKKLENIIRLPQDYLRKNNTVWVREENKLSIRQVDVLLKDKSYVYLDQGLESGDEVITTDLSTVKQGAEVQLKSERVDKKTSDSQSMIENNQGS